MSCCNIWKVFNEKSNLIKEYKHWKLLIRNRNTTLGNCVAITKRHMEKFSEISNEKMQEFAQVVKDIENSLKKAFNYDKINYQMLMMSDNHTHPHIIPRYSSPRSFANIRWVDDGRPKLPPPQKPDVSSEILQKVKVEIKKHV